MSRSCFARAGRPAGALQRRRAFTARRAQRHIDQSEAGEGVSAPVSGGSLSGMAAHQLRTPLTSLRMQAELLSTCRDANERRAYCAALMEGIDTLARLVDQIADLGTLRDLPSDTRAPNQVLLADAYLDAMAVLQDAAAEKSLRVVSRLGHVALPWHPVAVRVVVGNLLHNAVSYTPDGGQVQIAAAADARGVVLTVDDSGPGINPSRRAAAFDHFERLGRDTGAGAGLGLFLVQTAATLHGATVQLTQSLLGGLRAEVTVPATAGRRDEPPR